MNYIDVNPVLGFRRVTRISRGGRGRDARYKRIGGTGGILEFLDCLGLHFARFHGGDNIDNIE